MTILVRGDSWVLATKHSAYAFGISPGGALLHLYWGARLNRAEDYPPAIDLDDWASFSGSRHRMQEEFNSYAGASYVEPCLKATFADGVRDTS